VTSGGAIQGRVVPIDVLRRLQPELPEPGPGISPILLADYFAVGLRFRHKTTGETIPVAKAMMTALLPIAADGTFVANGLAAGDWQVFFGFPYPCQTISDVGKVEFRKGVMDELPPFEAGQSRAESDVLPERKCHVLLLAGGRPCTSHDAWCGFGHNT